MLFSRQQIAREDADGVISGGNVSGEAEMQKLNVNRLSLFIQLSSLGPGPGHIRNSWSKKDQNPNAPTHNFSTSITK